MSPACLMSGTRPAPSRLFDGERVVYADLNPLFARPRDGAGISRIRPYGGESASNEAHRYYDGLPFVILKAMCLTRS
jgi:hypothetical protein